jgi:hypothetical protein
LRRAYLFIAFFSVLCTEFKAAHHTSWRGKETTVNPSLFK